MVYDLCVIYGLYVLSVIGYAGIGCIKLDILNAVGDTAQGQCLCDIGYYGAV